MLTKANASCRLGLIPLVSHAARVMKGPFDDIGDNDFTDVELSLNITCTADDTIDVTSNDFLLDRLHPEVHPVGEACPVYSISREQEGTTQQLGPFAADGSDCFVVVLCSSVPSVHYLGQLSMHTPRAMSLWE